MRSDQQQLQHQGYLRLRDIVGRGGVLPVSKSYFYAAIQKGLIPKPIKLGRISLWRASDIQQVIEKERVGS